MGKLIQKVIKVSSKREYLNRHLYLINAILTKNKLTDREIDVLSLIFSQDKNLLKVDVFNKEIRKMLMQEFDMKPSGITGYVKSISNKGYLNRDELTGIVTVEEKFIPVFFPEENNQGYQFKIVIKDDIKK